MSVRFGHWIFVALAPLLLPGCAALQQKDPLNVAVAGIEPLQGQGLELRLEVKLRVQNPNDAPVEYDGVAVEMDVQGKTFATGVANVAGSVPRFGESVISVPVTISAFRMARQVMGAVKGGGFGKIEYEMKGKLNTGFSPTRFSTRGSFDLSTETAPDTR
ncbi:MAG TPA: LEA type 2 family protein [Steroidobacteraceae bacterium]|jgi:LEA14-like dessication related protein|nr:LEA type 2 family protein [Steroidobacteraceae bacterium]